MLDRKWMMIAGLGAVLAAGGVQAAEPDMKALAAEGKSVMMSFGKALKGELVAAMKEGGPQKAIPVCHLKSPKIAEIVSKNSGWKVGRSSHKLRHRSNSPDGFTRGAIVEFLDRQAKGEDPKGMIKTAIVEEDGKKVFRMVKAIPTAKVCLNCHGGDEVKPDTVALLKKLYPEDEARGFKVGEMRGVFTLSKVLP
jgi:hypothetical protein